MSIVVMNVAEKLKNKVQKIVNFDLEEKNKFSTDELIVLKDASINMSAMFEPRNASESATDFLLQEKELINQFDRFQNAYSRIISDVVLLFLKPVIERKKNYKGSEPFRLVAFMITKKIKIWLRDKIWFYCYYKGQEWIDSLYANDPKKPIGDIEGMKVSQNRARDIMEGVNHILKNEDIFEKLYTLVVDGENSKTIFQFLKENTPIGSPRGSLKLVQNQEEAFDNMVYYKEDFDIEDDFDNQSNKSHDDDTNVNTSLGVIEKTTSLSQTCKDGIKNTYEYIVKHGKNLTTNNGLSPEALGVNGYLTYTTFQYLLHYIGTDTVGYGIDFGGGYGHAALLLAATSKWKIVSTEINFDRYKQSIKLQSVLATQAASTNGNIELKEKFTENVFIMFTGPKTMVEIDWTVKELEDIKRKIFGDTNTTLTPRTASAGNYIPLLISSNNSAWSFIYFFSTGWNPSDIGLVLNQIRNFPKWQYFFTDLKPRYFQQKDCLDIIKPNNLVSKIIKFPKCQMAGQNHTRDFYLYIIVRDDLESSHKNVKKNNNNKKNSTNQLQLFTSTQENLQNEIEFLDTVSKYTKQGRHIRAAASKTESTFVPESWNRSITSSKKRKLQPPLSSSSTPTIHFTMEFIETLEEWNVKNKFPVNVTTLPEKFRFLSRNINNSKYDRSISQQPVIIPETKIFTEDVILNQTIEKLVQLDNKDIDTKTKKARLRLIAEQLLRENNSDDEDSNDLSKQKLAISKPVKKPVVEIALKNKSIDNDDSEVRFTPIPKLIRSEKEIFLNLFKELNNYPSDMKQNAVKMNANEYICSCPLDATQKPKFILFISKHELSIKRNDNEYSSLMQKENATAFLNTCNSISILYKMPTNRYYQPNEMNYRNFFIFLSHIIDKTSPMVNNYDHISFREHANDNSILTPIVKDLVSKLKNWCNNDIFKRKLQNIDNQLNTIESIEDYLPIDEQVDPQFLSLIDFPIETNPFSVFCDNQNIDGYAQLAYSFVDKMRKCPNIKYVATSFKNICDMVNGRFSLLRNDHYHGMHLNIFNDRYPQGTLVNELEPCFHELAEAIASHVRRNPKFILDLAGNDVDHFVPFPHPDSDNSDDDEDVQKKLSSVIKLRNNDIEFSHRIDLQCLRPANMINDNVINCYLFHIQKQYEKDNPNANVIICTDTNIYTAHVNKTTKNWSSETKWTSIYTTKQLQEVVFIVFPIFHSAHWVWFSLNVKNIKKVQLVCYDSMCTSAELKGWKRQCSEWIIGNVNEINENLKNDKFIDYYKVELISLTSYPQQEDSVNCGLYTLFGIEFFLKNQKTKFTFDNDDVLSYKTKIRKFFKDLLIKDYNERNKMKSSIDLFDIDL